MAAPTFYFDVSSPYAYLAAQRIDELVPVPVRWQPIAFGALIIEIGKTPWSLTSDTRAAGIAEVERRARERGLPPLAWPPGWPAESYSVVPLRAILVAAERGLHKDLTRALYHRAFVDGVALNRPEVVLEAAADVGLDPEWMEAELERQPIKDALRKATAEAIAHGVTGVPTVAVDGELFWGDDRLEAAAAALTPGRSGPAAAR
jgi:2-hydroxychromene-2-carboxylate isomerase